MPAPPQRRDFPPGLAGFKAWRLALGDRVTPEGPWDPLKWGDFANQPDPADLQPRTQPPTVEVPVPHIVVHHLERSRSHRILWLLEELGLPYELVTYQRHPKTMRAPASLKAIHPLGRAPIVVIDDQVHVESGAVIEAILDLVPDSGLRPTTQPGINQLRFWLHYAEGSLMPPLLVALITGQLRNAPVPFFLKPIPAAVAKQVDAAYTTNELKNHLEFIEAHLANRTWLLGDAISAADFQMSYPLFAAANRAEVHTHYPAISAWLGRINERPAWRAAIAKGGPLEV